MRRRRWSAREVLEDHIARIETRNPELNAIVAMRLDAARSDADGIDAALRDGLPGGPLCGVPFTVKDVLATADLPTTCGSLVLRGRRTQQDATVVSRLRAAGAVLIGKTNCPEFAFGIDTDNRLFGRTKNPVGPFIVGGSSGGEAASIAAGFSALGVGTDFGGSVRWPALCAGIVGLRPSIGRIPATGTLPAWLDREPFVPAFHTMQGRIQTVGLLARTVRDVWDGLHVAAGPDGYDGQSVPVQLNSAEDVSITRLQFRSGSRVVGAPPDPGVADAVSWASGVLSDAGASDVGQLPSQLDEAVGLYSDIRDTESLGDISSVVGNRHAELTPLVQRLLETTGSRDESAMAENWAQRDRLRGELLAWLDGNRVLVMPVCTRLPLGDADATDGGFEMLDPSRAVALFGLPALSVPCPRTPDGSPVSVQIVGPPFREDLVLAVGQQLERAREGAQHVGA